MAAGNAAERAGEMNEKPIATTGGGCQLITVDSRQHELHKELEALCRNPFATIGDFVSVLKRLEPWQPFIPNPGTM